MVSLDVAAPLVHVPAGRRQPARRRHQPALDGIRGVSVLLVLLYHGGWSWMPGGYVGVSVFFTLSGFLITRLLIDEHAATGRIDVPRFWGRRLRRLMPASMICLVGVAVLGALGSFGDVPDLGHDVLGALLQVANWFQLAGDVSYAEQVLGVRGPLDHYWSLAIEEQFYWVWPLVMAWALRGRRPGTFVVGLTAVSMVGAPLIAWHWGADAAYWATPARIGEIMVGAALAFLMRRQVRQAGPGLPLIGVPALAVIVWAAVRWPSGTGPAYDGRLPVFALASAALVLAVQQPSLLQRGLAWRPLAGLGAISYGVYLYHWPIFVMVERWGIGHATTFAIELTLTLAVATVSYRAIERPIRRGNATLRRLAPAGVTSVAAVSLLAVFASFGAADRFADPEGATSQLEPVRSIEPLQPAATAPPVAAPTNPEIADEPVVSAPEAVGATTAPPTVPVEAPAPVPSTLVAPAVPDAVLLAAPPRPVRMLVIGDSTAWDLGDGMASWATDHPDLASVSLQVRPGCGFVLSGSVPADADSGYAEDCAGMLDRDVPAAIADLKPDVALLMITRTDVKHRIWDPAEGVLGIDDPRFQQRLVADYVALSQWLLGAGVPELVWVLPPTSRPWLADPEEMHDEPAMTTFRALIADAVAQLDPARVTSLNLAGWLAGSGLDDEQMRHDGTHFDLDPAVLVTDRFVGPSLVNIAVGAA